MSRIFLVGDSLDKPHVRFDQGQRLVVSPSGTKELSFGFPDQRQERIRPEFCRKDLLA